MEYKPISNQNNSDKDYRSKMNNGLSPHKSQMNKGNEDNQNNIYATNEMESDSITYQKNKENFNRYNNNIESQLTCKSLLHKCSKENIYSIDQDRKQCDTYSDEYIAHNKVILNSPSKSLLQIKHS